MISLNPSPLMMNLHEARPAINSSGMTTHAVAVTAVSTSVAYGDEAELLEIEEIAGTHEPSDLR